ncbi:hypothetical protein GN244_ATG06178 [Phytophthora infestans]|uniref:Uncharacterized protein n=1 Tax=Phytophthora infestans TaxID=4787 RepID=A0A833WXT4_PHYIN|nr:hypothetical protein GN244_ATG06178 [Phytophthora infestans]
MLVGHESTPADVVANLKLNRGVDAALASLKLQVLISYVEMSSTKYPEKKVSVVGVLTTKYGEGAVVKCLVNAKEATRFTCIATKLQANQLHDWLKNNKTVKDVFTLLKIGEVNVHWFASSGKLEALDDYIEQFNIINPQHKTYLFSAGTSQSRSEESLSVY